MESSKMKRYVYVRNSFVFLSLFFTSQCSFGQETQHLKGDLSYNFFGYPTLYGLDSATHEKFLHIMEARHLKHKYRSLRNEYEVYHKLKPLSWQEYPCVEIALMDPDSTVYVFMNVDDYHRVIAKNQEQLDNDSLKVTLEVSVLEIIPGYYRLLELENVAFVTNPIIHKGIFANMDYAW